VEDVQALVEARGDGVVEERRTDDPQDVKVDPEAVLPRHPQETDPDSGRGPLPPLGVRALDGAHGLAEDLFDLTGELVDVDRRQRLEQSQDALHHAADVLVRLAVVELPDVVELPLGVGAAGAEVDEDDLAVAPHHDVGRVRIGMEDHVLEDAEEARLEEPPRHDGGIDVEVADVGERLLVAALHGGEELPEPDAGDELGDHDIVA